MLPSADDGTVEELSDGVSSIGSTHNRQFSSVLFSVSANSIDLHNGLYSKSALVDHTRHSVISIIRYAELSGISAVTHRVNTAAVPGVHSNVMSPSNVE
jgi:hypothetical protein